jgi:hypothetical protein
VRFIVTKALLECGPSIQNEHIVASPWQHFQCWYLVDIAYILYKYSFRTSERTPIFSVGCELNITTVQDLSTFVFSVPWNFHMFDLFEPRHRRLCKVLCTSEATLKETRCCVSVAAVVPYFVLGGVSARHGNRNSCGTLVKIDMYWQVSSQCVYWYYRHCYMPTDMARL